MNAQEAIAYMEQYVKELDNLISYHKAHDIEMLGGDHFPETVRKRHKELDDKREAMAIVLESAKLLHQSDLHVSRYNDFKLLEANIVVKSPTNKTFKSIGIQEGEK